MSKLIKKIIYILLFVLALLLGLVFFVKNHQSVEFNYVMSVIELPLSILMLISFLIGILIGIAALIPRLIKMRHSQSRLKRQLSVREKEINNLRVLPARDTD